MKQRSKRTLLSALLALALCLSLLPFGALAEESSAEPEAPAEQSVEPAVESPAEQSVEPAAEPPTVEAEAPPTDGVTEIARVTVTGVMTPVAGEEASFSWTIPADANYVKDANSGGDDCAWIVTDTAPTDWDSMVPESGVVEWYYASGYGQDDKLVFEAGKYYTFMIYLKSGEDATFASGVPATINGNMADTQEYTNHLKLAIWYTFALPAQGGTPTPTEIDSISITGVTAPVDGETMSFDWSLPADSGLYPYDDTVASLYKDCCWIVADRSYDKLSDIWLNGTRYYESSYDGETFEAETYVTFLAYVGADSGYVFADSVTGSINGTAANCNDVTDGTVSPNVTYYEVWYTFGPLEATAETIDSVTITGVTEPVAGKEIGFDFSVPADAGYEPDVSDCGCMGEWLETDWPLESYADVEDAYSDNDTNYYWYCENDPDDPDLFRAGYYYTYVAWVKPTGGNSFSDTLTATMNSSTAIVDGYGDYADIAYCFGATEGGTEIDRVDVTGVVEPVLGAEAGFNWAVPTGTDYKKWYDPDDPYNCAWIETDSKPSDYGDLEDDGVWYYENWGDTLSFGTGKYYSFLVWVEAEEGFRFEQDCMASLNGVTAETADYAYSDYIYLAVWYTFGPLSDTAPEPVEIDQVDILNVMAPVAGAKASFAFSLPADAPYRMITDDGITSSAWLETEAPITSAEELDDAFNNGGVYYDTETFHFLAGKYYTFVARTEPKAGNAYADGVIGTMNGVAAGTDILGDSEVDVFYCFEPAEAPEAIETITITNVVTPMDGMDFDFDFDLPAGADYKAFVDSYGDAAAWVKSDTIPSTLTELREDGDWYFLSDGGDYQFEEGYYYTFVAQLTPKSGQSFSPDATATINGKDAHVDVYVDFWVDAGGTDDERFVWYTFPVEELVGAEITKLEVLNVTKPEAGKEANFGWTVPDGANYSKDVDSDGDDCAWVVTDAEPKSWDDVHYGQWYYSSGWGRDDDDTIVFEEGKYYTFVAWLEPNRNYVFGMGATAFMNGEKAGLDYDPSSASVYQTFTVKKDGGADAGGDSKPEKPAEVPDTGDSGMPGLWLGLALLAAGGLTGLGLRRKKAKS